MKPLRIAQISDFHFTRPTCNPLRLCSKRLLGTLNWLFTRRSTFSGRQVESIAPLLKTLEVDHIFLGGDFTTTSLTEEFKLAANFVATLPAPWIAVPGNHDVYTQRVYHQKHFYRFFCNDRPITHKAGFFNLSEHGVEAHQLGNWWVVALDTARATWTNSAQGLFSPTLEKYLTEVLSLIPKDKPILMLNHYPFFKHDIERHTLERGEALEALIAKEPRIKAYLHGHTHQHIIANLQPSQMPIILDSGCCADTKKGSWNLLTIDDAGIQIDVYGWKNGWILARTETFTWTR